MTEFSGNYMYRCPYSIGNVSLSKLGASILLAFFFGLSSWLIYALLCPRGFEHVYRDRKQWDNFACPCLSHTFVRRSCRFNDLSEGFQSRRALWNFLKWGYDDSCGAQNLFQCPFNLSCYFLVNKRSDHTRMENPWFSTCYRRSKTL